MRRSEKMISWLMGLVLTLGMVALGPPAGPPPAWAEESRPVISLSRSEGPTAGGTVVTINGAGLEDVIAVRYGEVELDQTEFSFEYGAIRTISPPNEPGKTHVVVTDAAGRTSATTRQTQFTYWEGGAWNDAGSTEAERVFHTATRLDDGRVLVVGGSGSLATAEIYDPTESDPARAWRSTTKLTECPTAAGSLSCVGRADHTATLLDPPGCHGTSPAVPPGYPCGQVLIAGGTPDSGATNFASAQLYDPSSETWKPVASMIRARGRDNYAPDATATLLRDGRVLIVGSPSYSGAPRLPAEVYDPAEDRWDIAGSCSVCRGSATRLHDGRVLVTDSGGGGEVRSELFHPQTNTWTPTGSSRSHHLSSTTVLLPNGDVLAGWGPPETYDPDATGDYAPATGSQYTDSSPRRTPVTGGWKPSVRRIASGRVVPHTLTTLQDGRVLMAGGLTGSAYESNEPTAELFQAQGAGYDEDYELTAGRWTPATEMLIGRSNHTATLLDNGRVLVVGGFDRDGARFAAAELFDPVPGSSKPAPVNPPAPIIKSLTPPVSATSGNRVVITGRGFLGTQRVTFGLLSAPDFEVISDHQISTSVPPQPQGQVDVQVTTPGGISPVSIGTKFTYGPGSWMEVRRLHDCYAGHNLCGQGHTATALDPSFCEGANRPPSYPCGSVLVAAGTYRSVERELSGPGSSFAGKPTSSLYDPETEMWTTPNAMINRRSEHTATLLDGPACRSSSLSPPYCGMVLVAGGKGPRSMGRANVAVAVAELYDPVNDRWLPTGSLTNPRLRHTATLLDGAECQGGPPVPSHCGKVLVAGGALENVDGHALPSAELYDPLTGTWTPTARLDSCNPGSDSCTGRARHSAALLSDGTVLLVGGLGPVGDQDFTTPDPRCDVTGALAMDSFAVCEQPILKTAQLYDPAANGGVGGWKPTDDLHVERHLSTLTSLPDGRALATGGIGYEGFSAASEIYDPRTRTWVGADSLHVPRAEHSATLLPNGTVLVAGGDAAEDHHGAVELEPLAAAEVYDPINNKWTPTGWMSSTRLWHSATLLGGIDCGGAAGPPPDYCGRVLAVGGLADTAETYTPAPEVTSIGTRENGSGPPHGGLQQPTPVVIKGSGFAGATRVSFGDNPVASDQFSVLSPTEIRTTAPASGSAGTVEVVVENMGGTSASMVGNPRAQFIYLGDPGSVVAPVRAVSTSEDTIKISFGAAGMSGDSDQPAIDYVIKQSKSPITAEKFATAPTVCADTGGVCSFPTLKQRGDPTELTVANLTPGTRYYFAIAAKFGDRLGPISFVDATTTGEAPPPPTGGLGQVSDLTATTQSARELELSFNAVDDSSGKAATRYVIKQSDAAISESNFSSATSLCGSTCSFDVAAPGDRITLAVRDLKAATTYHYAVKALGEGDQQGPMSNVASATTEADTIAPDAVGDLTASPLSGSEIKLGFSAPASDAGEGPPVTNYVIKQSREPITEATFESAKTLCSGLCKFTPAAAGEQLSLSITGLESSSTYHYALKAVDEGDNVSGLSNMALATTSEVTPGKVTGLQASAKSMSKISLGFAAADDGTGEAATSYVIKQSNRAMRSEDDFSKAQTLCGESCRFEATEIGQRLRLSVTGLDPDTTYHYAIRALDDSGDNLGARSASVKATTRPDRIAPGEVDDLRARALSKTAIKLAFSAIASNGSKGPAVTTYIIKQSTRPITSASDFKKAPTLCGKVCTFDVAKVGARLSLKVTDLRPGTTYYYAVVAKDAGGNRGPRSKTARARISG